MPRYSVSFTIHEALFPSIRTDNPINPLIVVRCFGNEFTTSIKYSKTIVSCWDEGYHWNNLELSEYIWNTGIIDFELQSANALWRNDILGTSSLQLKLISTCKNNTFIGKIPLTALNSVRIIGYLSLTINAYDLSHDKLNNNNQPYITKEYEIKQPVNLEIPSLIDPQIYRSLNINDVSNTYKYFHLYINIYTLEDIQVDLLCNYPYITCEYGGCRLQSTKPIRIKCKDLLNNNQISHNIIKRSNFTFNQCFLIPISVIIGEPTLDDNIIIRVWMTSTIDLPIIGNGKDNGLINNTSISSRLLAEGIFSLAELRSRKQVPRWFNFYRRGGNDKDGVGNVVDATNSSLSNIMYDYIGRILLSASVKRILKTSDVLKAHVISSHQMEPILPSPTRIFSDVFMIESSYNFGYNNEFQISLELSCGPYTTSTNWQYVKFRNNNNDYGDNFPHKIKDDGVNLLNLGWYCNYDNINGRLIPLDILVAYKSDEQWYIFIKIFSKLNNNIKLLGSIKYTFNDISNYTINKSKIPFWISLQCNGDKWGNYGVNPPFLNVLMTLEKHMFYSEMTNISTNNEYRIMNQHRRITMINMNYELRCYIYSIILPEPIKENILVSIICNGKMKMTTCRNRYTRFPIFMECITIPINILSCPISMIATPIPIMINILIGNNNKCIYTSTINYNRLITSSSSTCNKSIAGKPKWLKLGNDNSYILLFIDLINNNKLPIYQMIPLVKNINIKLGILGLRNLITCNNIKIKATIQNYTIITNKQQEYNINCKITNHWITNNLHNCDLFTVQNLNFKIPIETIFNTHLELIIYNNQYIIGYCSFPIHTPNPPEVQCNSIPLHSNSLHPAVSSSNYLSLKSRATPGDRGGEGRDGSSIMGMMEDGAKDVLDVTSSGLPAADLREAKGQLNKESLHGEWKTSGGASTGLQCENMRIAMNDVMILDGIDCCMEDLRYSMVPYKMSELLELLHRQKNKNGYNFDDININSNYITHKIGIPEVLEEFECIKEYKKLNSSLSINNVSVYVPPKFILAVDGKKLINKSSVEYTLVADRQLDYILDDIPYNIITLKQPNHTNSPPEVTASRSLAESSSNCLSLKSDATPGDRGEGRSVDGMNSSTGPQVEPVADLREAEGEVNREADGRTKRGDKASSVGADVRNVMDNNPLPIMKYFLTIDDKYCSYNMEYKDIAIDSIKMSDAFRKGIKSTLYKLRFCIVSASNFQLEGKLTPYLVVEIANKENREILNTQCDRLTSDIYRIYEYEIFLPENSLIIIKVISSNEYIMGDIKEDIIATGYIDLENRWFSKKWQQMIRKNNIPIEKIYLQHNGNIQGYINAIIHVTKLEKYTLLKPLTFNHIPNTSIEIRIIIWSTRGVKLPHDTTIKDDNMLDLYMLSTLDCKSYNGIYPLIQKTDVHYNCNNGNAIFNWRIVYPNINTPLGTCHLQLALYDYWKLSNPIFIGEANLELKPYINIVSSTSNKINIDGEIPLINTNTKNTHGYTQITLQILTQNEATSKPVCFTFTRGYIQLSFHSAWSPLPITYL